MEVIKDFYNYLKHPVVDIRSNKGKEKSLQDCFILFAFMFSIIIFVITPMMSLIGVEDMEHAMELVEEKLSPWSLILLTVFVGPIIEELIFRLPLKYRYLVYAYDFLLINFLGFYIANQFGPAVIRMAVPLFLVISVFWILWRKKNIDIDSVSNFNRHFPFYFYAMAVFFAFFHITNFSLDPDMWWATPILVLPQFVLGLLLGYVRLKYGLTYAIFVHALNNFIPVMALVFFKDLIGMG